MDEAEITAKQEESKPEQKEQPKIENPDYLGKVIVKEWRPLYDFFKLEESNKHDKAFSKIWQWAVGQAPDQKTDSVLFEIRKLELRLGSSALGDSSFSKIENYITIQNRMRESEKLLREMEPKAGG